MKTEDLIRTLAADSTPVAPPALARLLLPAIALSLGLMVLILGLRDDLVAVLTSPLSMMRFVLTIALAWASIRACRVMMRPETGAKAPLWPQVMVAAVALSLWLWAYLQTDPAALGMAIRGKTMVTCLVAIPVMSVAPVAALFLTLRHGATTTPTLTGALIGLAGGGAAAAIYALHCTEDSPLFYVTWYSTAILGVTLASAAIGTRVLRW